MCALRNTLLYKLAAQTQSCQDIPDLFDVRPSSRPLRGSLLRCEAHEPSRALLCRVGITLSGGCVALTGPTQKCFHNLVLLIGREHRGLEPSSKHDTKSIASELSEIGPVLAVPLFDFRRMKMVVTVVADHLGELMSEFVVAKLFHVDGKAVCLMVAILGHDTGARGPDVALRLY
jgi:hypothetical protein